MQDQFNEEIGSAFAVARSHTEPPLGEKGGWEPVRMGGSPRIRFRLAAVLFTLVSHFASVVSRSFRSQRRDGRFAAGSPYSVNSKKFLCR